MSEATLHKWRAEARGKGQLLPDVDAGPEGWSSRDKFAAVLETAALNEADLGEYCRTRGLYPAQIAAWTASLRAAAWLHPSSPISAGFLDHVRCLWNTIYGRLFI
jgi:hypothetical protein